LTDAGPGPSWAALPECWRASFEEAWTSWASGSAGVGAVVTDGDGAVVSRGRNRVLDVSDGRSPLAGTYMAHAEMNALACLPVGDYTGYTIYTTFEPCLMCAGTIRLYGVPHIAYAAGDPVWDGLHEVFSGVPAVARRLATRSRLGGPFGEFAHVLHLSWLATCAPPPVTAAHARLAPDHVRAATRVNESGELRALADTGGTVVEAAAAIWSDVVALAGEPEPG
jgi:tRNA(adenine34) deaminase